MPKLLSPILILLIVAASRANPAAALDQHVVKDAAATYQKGNWPAALELLTLVVDRASEPETAATARFYVGECSLQLGRYADAQQAYQQVLSTPAAIAYHPRASFRLGELARLSGSTVLAEQKLRKFLEDFPRDALAPSAYAQLGDIAAEQLQTDKAVSLYQAALNREPQGTIESQARMGLARALLANGNASQVAVVLGSLTESTEEKIRLPALMLRGRAEYECQQFDQSLKTFRLASQLDDTNLLANRARLAAGWSLWKLARCEEIAAEIGSIPKDPALAAEHHYLLGMSAYNSHDWATAIGHLTQSISEASSSIQSGALYYLGESCLQNKLFPQAKKWMTMLADKHPRSDWADDAVWALSRIARETTNRSEFDLAALRLRSQYAASDYVRLLDIHPWNTESNNSQGDITVGAEAFEEAVGLERDGYLDAALAAYQEFNASSGENSLHAEALWRTARLHYRLSQKREAAENYNRLITDFPQFDRSAEALLNLARIEADLGDHDTAKNRHKELLEKFPQSSQADEAAYWLALAAADGKDSESAQWYLTGLLSNWEAIEGITSERQTQLYAQAICLKCQLAAQEQRWQEISDMLSRENLQVEAGPIAARLAYWRAEAEFRLGNHSEAQQSFEDIQRLTLGLAEPWVPMVSLRKAQLAARKQQWKRVLMLVEEIDNTYPEFEIAYEADYLRGRAQAGLGRMTDAREAYQAVLQNALTDSTETAAMAQWMIGESYFHQRDYENAQDAYQKVIQDHHFPEWQAKAALQAGKCAELQGKWLKAVTLYEHALQNWKGTDVTEKLTSRLEWAQRQATRNTSTLRE